MKIVNFYELCAMPKGTIFAEWTPCVVGELQRLDDIIYGDDGKPTDYFYCDVAAFMPNGDGPCVSSCGGRWGAFDYDEKYLVWEKEDVERMVRILLGTDTEDDNVWPEAPIWS